MLWYEHVSDRANALFPKGTPCVFLPGAKDGPGRESHVRESWWFDYSGTLVTMVEGYPGTIAATHIEVNGRPVLEAIAAIPKNDHTQPDWLTSSDATFLVAAQRTFKQQAGVLQRLASSESPKEAP